MTEKIKMHLEPDPVEEALSDIRVEPVYKLLEQLETTALNLGMSVQRLASIQLLERLAGRRDQLQHQLDDINAMIELLEIATEVYPTPERSSTDAAEKADR
jgi:hypothetical protein